MKESLKHKTISGMIWNGVERFGSSFFLFVSNLVLARLLSPSDFGCIGMLLVFISVSDAIIDGGFGSALIQKKNTTQIDYSTIFYWNIILSVFLYGVLYLSAPAIAEFYKIPLLSDILKVQGVILVINALVLIQQNVLKKQVAFKKLAKINLSSIIVGTGAGILAAFLGFGVWSLVIKSLVTGVVQCVIYWLSSHWRPQWVFSWASFRSLFSFGSFMFLSTITNTLYSSLLSLIIGRNYNSATLGYYTQARKLEDVPRNTLSSIVNNVTFSIFSGIQDEKSRIKAATSKCLKSLMFVTTPLMILLILVAEPLFFVLFGEKWLNSVAYFQALCLHGLVYIPFSINLNVIRSLGKSRLYFNIITTQSILGIILVTIAGNWGMMELVLCYTITPYLSYIFTAYKVGHLINYGLGEQFKNILRPLVCSLASMILSYLIWFKFNSLNSAPLLLIIGIITFSAFYLILSKLFNNTELIQQFKIISQYGRNK